MRKVVKFILLGLLFGVLLYATIYFMASRGDAFTYVDQKIRSSSVVESKIGSIKRIRLDPFGAYEEKSVGSDEWATMRVEVTGSKTTIALDVKVKKMNGNWAVEQVISQGSPLALD